MSENSVAQSPSENTVGKKLLVFGVSALCLMIGVTDAEAAPRNYARQGRGSHAYKGTNQQAPVYIPPVQQQFSQQQPQRTYPQQPQGYPQQNYQPPQGYPEQQYQPQYQHPQYRYNPNVERYPSPPPSPRLC